MCRKYNVSYEAEACIHTELFHVRCGRAMHRNVKEAGPPDCIGPVVFEKKLPGCCRECESTTDATLRFDAAAWASLKAEMDEALNVAGTEFTHMMEQTPKKKESVLIPLLLCGAGVTGLPTKQAPLHDLTLSSSFNRTISTDLFFQLEELARIVDISYCVGMTGIQKPFLCASRCQEFPDFELIRTWNTGPLMADSSGYIAVSHSPTNPRIIIAFRGTYSVANTIIDLSTIPQEYVPYPGDGDEDEPTAGTLKGIIGSIRNHKRDLEPTLEKCENCTVHAGFMTSWRVTRSEILADLEETVATYPTYQVELVGHSLGGAVAALASLDLQSRGWDPRVTTFGEPKVGNDGLVRYIDKAFKADSDNESEQMYRRVTHVEDPVPLLPLREWGYQMHAGEVYISKQSSSPSFEDLQHCQGDEDPLCISQADPPTAEAADVQEQSWNEHLDVNELWNDTREALTVPARYRLWQLFFAHRDYFWRLGLCVPGGDPWDYHRKYPREDADEL
ncbi:hypothetical protein MMC25_001440 [Agyrium rufum]|nr:hypothetical protein [Agyrium rufum]